SVIFYVEAYHTANSEGDDFVFAYSTDNVNFTDMVTVTKTADDDIAELYALPNTLSGTVYIRVTDTDSSQGNKGLDTVYVDAMYIRSSGEAPPNQAPTFSSDPVVEVDGAVDIAYSATLSDDATDPEGDPMTFSKVGGPAWLVVASDGTLSGTPTAADEGLNSFTVQVDATGGTDTATLSITVNAGMPSVHVSSIVPGVAAANGPNQYGVATVTILDASDQPVSGVTVSGTFTGSYSESGSAVTDGSGVAVIQTAGKTKNPSFTFTVDSVTASGYVYDSASNVETSDSY
ncbi:MAG TPA: putative Ig domain-containing protein, partial [Pontiella sp.]